jgi:TRAP-type uncharacterized transport system fused permease subunit
LLAEADLGHRQRERATFKVFDKPLRALSARPTPLKGVVTLAHAVGERGHRRPSQAKGKSTGIRLRQAFRRRLAAQLRLGLGEFLAGLEFGARNMTAVGIATATAGIIVGTVTLTGIGLVMTEIVEFLSAGNFVIMLVLTGLICLVLGTGLPTRASYVVVATLMAPVVVELAAQNDVAVPMIAVHMFVFYFGLMADVSPPVGLAAYTAGAIANADPLKVGWQGMR